MPRFFIKLSFKGTAYSGWQIQANAVTVQEKLNIALSTLMGHQVITTGCGRTDTGVHAKQFYVHLDVPSGSYDPQKTVYALNAILPKDIAIHEFIPVSENQHARFDASSRTYEYFIATVKNPFLTAYTMYSHDHPNIALMNEACGFLLQQGDFSSFSKSNTQVKTNICNITGARWETRGNLLVFKISADRFLRGMVRAIVGTLLEVGTSKISADRLPQIIALKSRSEAGVTVPACGLYLSKIEYPFLQSSDPMNFPA